MQHCKNDLAFPLTLQREPQDFGLSGVFMFVICGEPGFGWNMVLQKFTSVLTIIINILYRLKKKKEYYSSITVVQFLCCFCTFPLLLFRQLLYHSSIAVSISFLPLIIPLLINYSSLTISLINYYTVFLINCYIVSLLRSF